MVTGCEQTEITYIVPELDSDQSESAVSRRLLTSPSVDAVLVDLATKGVTVHGHGLDALNLRALIESAGYQAFRDRLHRPIDPVLVGPFRPAG